MCVFIRLFLRKIGSDQLKETWGTLQSHPGHHHHHHNQINITQLLYSVQPTGTAFAGKEEKADT